MRTRYWSSALLWGAAVVAAATACGRDREPRARQSDARIVVPLPADVQPTPAAPTQFASIGRRATPAEIREWDIDVNPTGAGLPSGRGTYAAGATLFAQRCAVCHGAHGEGLATYPRLIGREPRTGFPFGQDAKYVKTIGNYWPYATTVYDYIHRAMPLTAPGSLTGDEVYSVVAFLLAENEIIDRATVIDAHTLPKITMPAHNRFVADNRTGGPVVR